MRDGGPFQEGFHGVEAVGRVGCEGIGVCGVGDVGFWAECEEIHHGKTGWSADGAGVEKGGGQDRRGRRGWSIKELDIGEGERFDEDGKSEPENGERQPSSTCPWIHLRESAEIFKMYDPSLTLYDDEGEETIVSTCFVILSPSCGGF